MEQIYIVVNESHRNYGHSFYILEGFHNKDKAYSYIRECAEEFAKKCDEGNPTGFDDCTIKGNCFNITFEDSEGHYEKFYFQMINLN